MPMLFNGCLAEFSSTSCNMNSLIGRSAIGIPSSVFSGAECTVSSVLTELLSY